VRVALAALWPYTRELFDSDEVDEDAATRGLGPRWSELREPWFAEIAAVFDEAKLGLPPDPSFRSEGRQGRHSEHMGFILAELQYLQRAFPGGAW
jgi:ring-1,2-phenylacetyl-CoA epoxidase subunit PaaC